MEFRFSVNDIFRHPIVKIGNNLLPPGFTGDRRAFWDIVGKVSEVVNAMGESSAAAQGLTKPITTAERLRNSEHTVYLLVDQNAANGRGAVTGMLKTGKKGLYVFDRNGQHFQVSPPCVLDFYVHESRQRTGLGKRLFEHMLQEESIEPVKMAIDRPSEKFLGFLNKHYALNSPVKQMNNYVVFDGFFPNTPEKNGSVEIDHSVSTPGKKQSANGLQTTSYASPLGRYGAPRPPCSMGQIIHNQTSTIPTNTEPTGVEGVRSLPETNCQLASNNSPGDPNVTQSTPNMNSRQKKKLDGLDQDPNQPHYTMEEISRYFQQPNQRDMYGYSEDGVYDPSQMVPRNGQQNSSLNQQDNAIADLLQHNGTVNQPESTTPYQQPMQNAYNQNVTYPQNAQLTVPTAQNQVMQQNMVQSPGMSQNISGDQNVTPHYNTMQMQEYTPQYTQPAMVQNMQPDLTHEFQNGQYATDQGQSVPQRPMSVGYTRRSMTQIKGDQYVTPQNPPVVHTQMTTSGGHQLPSYAPESNATQYTPAENSDQAQQYNVLQPSSQYNPQCAYHSQPSVAYNAPITDQSITPPQYPLNTATSGYYQTTSNIHHPVSNTQSVLNTQRSNQLIQNIPSKTQYMSQANMPIQHERVSKTNMTLTNQRASQQNVTYAAQHSPNYNEAVYHTTSQSRVNAAAGDLAQNMTPHTHVSKQNIVQPSTGGTNHSYQVNHQTEVNSPNGQQTGYAPSRIQYQNNAEFAEYAQGPTNTKNEIQAQNVPCVDEQATYQYGYPSQIPEPLKEVTSSQMISVSGR